MPDDLFENRADFRGDLLRFSAQKSAPREVIVWVSCLPPDATPETVWAEAKLGDWMLSMVHRLVRDGRLRYRAGLAVALLAKPIWPENDDLQKLANAAVTALEAVIQTPNCPLYGSPGWAECHNTTRTEVKRADDAGIKAAHAFLQVGSPAVSAAGHALMLVGFGGDGLLAVAQQTATALAHAAIPEKQNLVEIDAIERSQAWKDAYAEGLAMCADAIRTVIKASDVWPLPAPKNDGEENAPA